MSQGAVPKDEAKRAHFVFIPLMAQGHIIPAIDTALLLSSLGASCTIVATPHTAARVRPSIEQSGLDVRLAEFPLEYVADGADNIDNMPRGRVGGYFPAVALLRAPIEEYLRTHAPRTTCIVADVCLPWTSEIASNLGVPRLSISFMSAFSLLCGHNIEKFDAYEGIVDSNQPVVVPGLERRLELTKAQTTCSFKEAWWGDLGEQIARARAQEDGIIINSFLEMEPEFVHGYADAIGKKVWTVGPVSLYHDRQQKTRGNAQLAIDADECLRWLDGKKPGSVVYVSFGSIAQMDARQVTELGHGLEMSGHPFIWVLKKADQYGDSVNELEARVAGRGLIIRGWAPQVLILSHTAVGGFVTHGGWNSLMEAITTGTPLLTWPQLHLSDQSLNEKMVVEILGIGLSIGLKAPAMDMKEIVVASEQVSVAVSSILGGGEEGDLRRMRARALAGKSRAAMEEGGSSYANLRELVNRFTV